MYRKTTSWYDIIFKYVRVCVLLSTGHSHRQVSRKVVCPLCGLTFDVSKTVRFGRGTQKRSIVLASLVQYNIIIIRRYERVRTISRICFFTFVYDNNGPHTSIIYVCQWSRIKLLLLVIIVKRACQKVCDRMPPQRFFVFIINLQHYITIL